MTRFLAALGLALLPPLGLAATPPVLAGFTDGLRGLDGRFVQRVFDADGQLTEESQGRVALAAPRQFRWEYEGDFPQLIVADGDQVWIYDPDLEQVQVRKQALEEQHSPLAALVDPAELDRQFRVTAAPSEGGLDWVMLAPKADDAQIENARLGFKNGELARMTLQDALGQTTEIAFQHWRRNPEFAVGTFGFTPPPGVDVVGEMIDSAEVTPIED
jgi:outer membrane lipoprotein carrier protein